MTCQIAHSSSTDQRTWYQVSGKACSSGIFEVAHRRQNAAKVWATVECAPRWRSSNSWVKQSRPSLSNTNGEMIALSSLPIGALVIIVLIKTLKGLVKMASLGRNTHLASLRPRQE